MSRVRGWLVGVVASVCWSGTEAMAQRAPEVAEPVPARLEVIERVMPDLGDRLSRLDPKDPEAYFLLAEEVADIAVEAAERDLAQRLYLIAFDRWRAMGDTRRAASACIGLAEVVASDRDARWLHAIARSLEPRYATPAWESPGVIEVDPVVAYQAAAALGATRSGDGVAARQLLSDQSVTLVLERFGSLLQPAGGLTRVQRDANVWPCPECRNRRVSRSRVPGETAERICASCRGDPGPRMTDAEIIAHLRLESLLLSGTQQSWAAQVVVDDGAPLRDPDPDQVAATLGVDTSLDVFRGGVWVASAPKPETTDEPEVSQPDDLQPDESPSEAGSP